ncbi:MAG: YjbQ family protein [Candidatus Rokubacteria bacterium]|nr:YjbQ family protein [Candidatus Rokubacteria bacterium]
MKPFNRSLTIRTADTTEVADLTKQVRQVLQESIVTTGMALVTTMHTTCAVFVNEFQSALMNDILGLANRLMPERGGFRHDDPRYSDCERGNAHAHLRTALLGQNVTVGVVDGELVLGRFQSIIFAEFDGPRVREVRVQAVGQ